MNPGEIIAHGHDLYIVLAGDETGAALAPLLLARHNRVTHAVPVRAGGLGDGYVLCASARVHSDKRQLGGMRFSGYCLSLRDLEACQLAARRAAADADLTKRYAPLCAFEQAMPRIKRAAGRRVAPRLAL